MPVSWRGPAIKSTPTAPPAAAPSVVGTSSTGGWANNGTANPDFPSGVTSGMLVLALGFARFTGQVLNPISGYTLLSGDNDAAGSTVTTEISAKIAGSSEAAIPITSNIAASQPTGGMFVVVKDWIGSVSSLIISPVSFASNGSNVVFPDATALAANSLVLRIAFCGDDNTILTPMANATLVKYDATPLGSDAAFVIYSHIALVPGAVGTANVTMGGSDPWNTYTLIIPPAGT